MTNSSVERIDTGCKSICENGKRRRSSEAEILLSAVGTKPLKRQQNYKDKILVNAYNQTNIPGYTLLVMLRQDKRYNVASAEGINCVEKSQDFM
jgi:dihydrolipoamide dehydrogenase